MDLLAALHDWSVAAALRRSAWLYVLANATHILGIGLILGAALPMDLRILGAFPRVPLTVTVPFLSRVAATGVAVAAVTGFLLFSVNPTAYLGNPAFRAKLVLILCAMLVIAAQHGNPAFRAALAGGAVAPSVRVAAGLSLVLWLAILLAGRWVGFL